VKPARPAAICEALGVTVGEVQRAEYRCKNDNHGRALLANRPDSIEGLSWIGELDGNAADRLHYHHYHHECQALEGLSEAAALGRAYVSRMDGIGPKSLASIDRALALFGIAWSPIDRTPTPKPLTQQRPAMSDSTAAAWSAIVQRVGEIERAVGAAVLESDPHRDCVDRVAWRLAYLTGRIEVRFEKHPPHKPMRDITPEPDSSEDLETAGNLVCLPGVKLADVLQHDGGQP
jgi:hypothetical protein